MPNLGDRTGQLHQKSLMLSQHRFVSCPRDRDFPLRPLSSPPALPGPSSVTHPLGPSAGHLRPTAVMLPRNHRLQPMELLSPRAPAFLRPRSCKAQSRTLGVEPEV